MGEYKGNCMGSKCLWVGGKRVYIEGPERQRGEERKSWKWTAKQEEAGKGAMWGHADEGFSGGRENREIQAERQTWSWKRSHR